MNLISAGSITRDSTLKKEYDAEAPVHIALYQCQYSAYNGIRTVYSICRDWAWVLCGLVYSQNIHPRAVQNTS